MPQQTPPLNQHHSRASAALSSHHSLSQTDDDGETALMMAAHVGNISIMKQLLEAGASADKECRGRTALMFARGSGHEEIAALLNDKFSQRVWVHTLK